MGVDVLMRDNEAVGVNILTKGGVRCSLDKTCFLDGIWILVRIFYSASCCC